MLYLFGENITSTSTVSGIISKLIKRRDFGKWITMTGGFNTSPILKHAGIANQAKLVDELIGKRYENG